MPTVAELAQQELSRRYSLQGRTQVAPRVQTMQNARPTVRSALSNLMRDAVDATGLEGGYRQGLLNAAGGVETAVDFLPVVGDVLGLEDASRAYGQGDMVGAGINMMGVVPIIGDAGVKLSKGARSALRDQGFTEGFFHASKQDIQDGFKAGYGDGMVFVTPEREFANNWVGKGKYQQRLGEENIDDMRRADRQKLWDEYESQYGSYENWPSEIVDEYFAKQSAIVRQYDASGGAIYPVAVKANNQFDPEENPEVIAEFLKSQGRDPNATTIVSGKTDLEAYQEGNYLFYENKEMADFLKEKGYDSLWLREDTTKTGLAKPFSTLAVLDETGVKPVYDFAREADTAASALRGLDSGGNSMQQRMLIPDVEEGRRRLYNAGTIDRDPQGYLEPHTSDWVKEVAEGSGYEGNIEDITSDLVYMSEKPDWVTSIIARDIGKDMADVTLDDVRRYGRLNIIDAEIDADEIFQIGDYSQTRKIKDIAGNERNLWDTSLYDDERFADIPIGPEPEDFISNESQKITYTLTGDDLVDFLNENQPDMMQRLKESASSSGKSALRGLDINAEVANAKAAYDANPNNEELRRSYMALRRERDAMPAEEVTSPLSGSGTDAMMPRDIYDMDEDEYIKAINPQGSRIAPEARPNLGMGDMYGMAPRNAEEVMTQELPSGEIIRYVQDGDSVYALGYNPDLGEEDVIGYMVGGGDGSELAVVDQMQGQGIGGNLSYLYRSQNPMAQSGGFTEAGEAAARQAYRRMMGYE